MTHAGHKPKSWFLNYPALACMLNGDYYIDYAGMLGTMGVTCDESQNVGWAGKLGGWSC